MTSSYCPACRMLISEASCSRKHHGHSHPHHHHHQWPTNSSRGMVPAPFAGTSSNPQTTTTLPRCPLQSRWPGQFQGLKPVCLLVACLTSQQQASVSQGRICSDNYTCCHTETEAADPTFYLTLLCLFWFM